MPEEAEAARLRKGADALWMATLPIKLPVRPRAGGWGGWAAEAQAHCAYPSHRDCGGLRAPGRGLASPSHL